MNYAAAATTKTVTRVFKDTDAPVHLRNEILRIKAEAMKSQKIVTAPAPAPAPAPAVASPSAATPKSPRPEFLEPVSPKAYSPAKLLQEYQRKNMEEYRNWEIEQPSTYLRQIEFLENMRSKITRKGKLSAKDLDELEEIDERIEDCENALADLEDEYFEDSE